MEQKKISEVEECLLVAISVEWFFNQHFKGETLLSWA